jgi:hypothetical protein
MYLFIADCWWHNVLTSSAISSDQSSQKIGMDNHSLFPGHSWYRYSVIPTGQPVLTVTTKPSNIWQSNFSDSRGKVPSNP